MRPEFGRDRVPLDDRWCPAWPKHPDTPAKAKYTRWIKGYRPPPTSRNLWEKDQCPDTSTSAT